MMQLSFQRHYPPARPTPGPSYWFLFRGNDLLVQAPDSGLTLPLGDETAIGPLVPPAILFLGMLNGVPCLAGEVSAEAALPAGWRAVGIRELFGHLGDNAYGVVGYAAHILHWQRESRFCPVCGQQLDDFGEQWMRQCPNCDYTGYPRVSPAILALIHDGERVLLVHKPGWGARFSIVAGFVEPGESLEQCVQREVLEEVGVEVTDIAYVSSQPWPFPHQLMVGFTARYAGGQITPDRAEIDQAEWFRFDQLPELPAPLSLSRQLIDRWANTHR
jgi:NAD+ diphosphatase